MPGGEPQEINRRYGDVMKVKTICDKCRRYCNTFDKSRGMPCKDFERKDAKVEHGTKKKGGG